LVLTLQITRNADFCLEVEQEPLWAKASRI
jgi:hypothetical protein